MARLGSSTSSRASEKSPEVGASVTRLVTLVFKTTVRLICGTGAPAGVGSPPVQTNTISPTSSVFPSDRASRGTAELAVHVVWALAVAKLAHRIPALNRARDSLRIFIPYPPVLRRKRADLSRFAKDELMTGVGPQVIGFLGRRDCG